MIKLESDNEFSELFQEGMIDNVLNRTKDMKNSMAKGLGEKKTEWNNTKGILNKGKLIDSEIKKGSNNIGKISNAISSNTSNNQSIIARARNSILQFPVYITQSIRINEAHIIGKLFERVYATEVQTVLAQNQIISVDQAQNLLFLKQFHTNLTESAEILFNKYYEAIDDLDQMMCESIFHKVQLTDNLFVEFRMVPTINEHLIMENARLMNEPLKGFLYLKEDKSSIDISRDSAETSKSKSMNSQAKSSKSEPKEEESKKIENKNSTSNDYIAKKIKTTEKQGHRVEIILTDDQLKRVAKGNKLFYTSDKSKGQPNVDAVKDMIRRNNGKLEFPGEVGNIYVRSKTGKDGKEKWEYYIPAIDGKNVTIEGDRDPVELPKLLKDGDIKKFNGMLPYTMEATFRLKTNNGDLAGDIKFVIGVKTVLHLISAKTLSEDLREIMSGDNKTLQNVRYKTGEISSMDYFFNIKGLKADAAKNINYEKRWLNTLKRLGEYEKINGTVGLGSISKAITGGQTPVPNATLIISQPEVEMITNQTGIDLTIVSNVKKLAKTLFLMGFVIIDSTRGTIRVLFPDSDSSWDVQALSSIDAELSKSDNSQIAKELNRMINK